VDGDSEFDGLRRADSLLGFVDWFEIHDLPGLEKALAGRDDVDGGEDGEWTWYGPSEDGRRVVGELGIDGDSLALETHSEADADYCCSRLEAAAGSAVRFLIGQECHKPWGVPES
jgi:hypothetical protein